MRTKLSRLLALLSLLICIGGYSQDKISLKNGSEIDVWITEKSDKEIKYKIYNTPDSPVIVIKTKDVDNVTLRDGQIINLSPYGIYSERRLGINGGLMYGLIMNSGLIKFEADYFITPQIDIVLNGLAAGFDGGGINLGAKYYMLPYDKSKLKPYIGLTVGSIHGTFVLQTPLGIDYSGKRGFNIKFGLSGLYAPGSSDFGLYSELLFGWRFLKKNNR